MTPSESVTMSTDAAIYRRVTRRILPLLFLGYVVSYLDRVNVGFAKLQMMSDLQFSDTVYGLGAGIFFLGYFLFEIPSNLILHRVGARRWIARIMITWSVVSGAMMRVDSVHLFYLLRFLLGLAEAGFFPGVILYVTYWYPAARRGRVYALLMTAVAVSGVIGGPLSGWVLHAMSGLAGLAGWQWMFLVEALPSALLGVAVWRWLPDRIDDAGWLTAAQRELLRARLAIEDRGKLQLSLVQVIGSRKLWQLALIYFCLVAGLYGVSFWLPTLIRASGVKEPLAIGLLSSIPYAVAAVAMLVNGTSADRHDERRWHLMVPALCAGIGLLCSISGAQYVLVSMVCLTVATAGILSALASFWSLPTALVGGSAAAAGIAMINALGNLAGFASPYAVGWLRDATHSSDAGMVMMAVCMLLAALLTWLLPDTPNQYNHAIPVTGAEQ